MNPYLCMGSYSLSGNRHTQCMIRRTNSSHCHLRRKWWSWSAPSAPRRGLRCHIRACSRSYCPDLGSSGPAGHFREASHSLCTGSSHDLSRCFRRRSDRPIRQCHRASLTMYRSCGHGSRAILQCRWPWQGRGYWRSIERYRFHSTCRPRKARTSSGFHSRCP